VAILAGLTGLGIISKYIPQQARAGSRHFDAGFLNADCFLLTDCDAAQTADTILGIYRSGLAAAHFKYAGCAGFQTFFAAVAFIFFQFNFKSHLPTFLRILLSRDPRDLTTRFRTACISFVIFKKNVNSKNCIQNIIQSGKKFN
jgi:hypothetical protein